MLHTLKLLLPALIPSWRFFDRIAPSPRIEFKLLKSPQDISNNWQEFRPQPEYVSFFNMLKRFFYNPQWNESLFLVSCAERLMAEHTNHSEQEILKRIKAELMSSGHNFATTPYLQFRLVFLVRNGKELQKHVTFISSSHQLSRKIDS